MNSVVEEKLAFEEVVRQQKAASAKLEAEAKAAAQAAARAITTEQDAAAAINRYILSPLR
eukprot:484670-Prorocentrum_minimum.AAC.1